MADHFEPEGLGTLDKKNRSEEVVAREREKVFFVVVNAFFSFSFLSGVSCLGCFFVP